MDQGLAYILEEAKGWSIEKSNDGLYEGQFYSGEKAKMPDGVGRHQGEWGLFEGKHFASGLGREYGRMIWPSGNLYTGWFDDQGIPINGTFIIGTNKTHINSTSLTTWAKNKKLKQFNHADMFLDLFGLKTTTEILSKYPNPVNPSVVSYGLQSMFEKTPDKISADL